MYVTNFNDVAKMFTKKTKKHLIISSILIVVFLILFIIVANINNDSEYVDLEEISSSEGKIEEQKAYIDIISEPYLFASNDKNDDKYYIVINKYNYYSLVKMTSNDYDKYKDATKENPIRINGITITAPKEIKKFAIEEYNAILDEEYEKISLSDFESYFGTLALSVNESPEDVGLFVLIAFIEFSLLVWLIVTIINLIIKKIRIKNMSDMVKNNIFKEVSSSDFCDYPRTSIGLGPNSIIFYNKKITTEKYDDIVLIHRINYRVYGVEATKVLIMINKNGKKRKIQSNGFYNYDIEEIQEHILKMNKDVLCGLNKENRKILKEKYGIKKI